MGLDSIFTLHTACANMKNVCKYSLRFINRFSAHLVYFLYLERMRFSDVKIESKNLSAPVFIWRMTCTPRINGVESPGEGIYAKTKTIALRNSSSLCYPSVIIQLSLSRVLLKNLPLSLKKRVCYFNLINFIFGPPNIQFNLNRKNIRLHINLKNCYNNKKKKKIMESVCLFQKNRKSSNSKIRLYFSYNMH